MPEPHKLRIFLCYAPPDKGIIQELFERLNEERWIEPWMDEEKLLPGMDWNTEVQNAVASADAMIVAISKNAILENKFVHPQLKFVLNHALENSNRPVFIIPLRLDDIQIPRHIQSWQYYDFSIPDKREDIYQRLVRSLQLKANLDANFISGSQSAHIVSSGEAVLPTVPAPDVLGQFSFSEIPKGKFLMGSRVSNPLAAEDEIPQHPCYIPYDYWISRYPITNEQFGEYAVSNKRTDVLMADWRKNLNHPATNISWHNAVSYVNWLNKVFGKELEPGLVFRLPTEAEWERAARGDFGREWPWGNESLDDLIAREIAYSANRPADAADAEDFSGSNEVSDFFAKIFKFDKTELFKVNGTTKPGSTTRWKFKPRVDYVELAKKIAALRSLENDTPLGIVEVGTFSPFTDSPYKVGDMMGTITEWTQSLYAPYPYDASDGRENLGGDGKRVVRGLFTPAKARFSVRCAQRFRAQPNEKARLLGFRIVIAPPTS